MIRFKDLPEEIQNRMLDEQERQGNTRNERVLRRDIFADDDLGGFFWENSEEGDGFWRKILVVGNIDTFYEKYPKST